MPGHNDYSDFKQLPDNRWIYGDTLTFTPDINDSIASGMLIVAVRHNNTYPYSNLWLEVTYPTSPTDVKRDTINLQLADIYGRWHGKGFGAGYQYADTVSKNVTLFNHQPITVRHVMRIDTLPDIELLGVTFVSSSI